MSVSLLVLGICSFLFHASLRQTLEFADEFSMLGLSWSLLQATLTIRQSRSKVREITIDLAFCFVSFAIFYVRSPKIIFQVIAFIVSLLIVILRTQYLDHFAEPALPKEKSSDWNARTWRAIIICVFGYFLWNIDLEFCALLREMRQSAGLPWAWALEFHGWWHVLTAIGASQFMDVAREIRAEVGCENQEDIQGVTQNSEIDHKKRD
ncbi:alkaline ceramidase ydc1 [Lecanicillium sp. MT-2017a]|nr:alkaline ceramidase ydc1 [Lecanicillium sp. MT-2017a]